MAIDISWFGMILMYLLLFLPAGLLFLFKVKLLKEVFISAIRMTLQLGLVGLYLGFIFEINNPWLNLAWVLVMITVANVTVLRTAGLKVRYFFTTVALGIILGTGSIAVFFILFVVQPEPFYDAAYVIPITGMILGNCLRANVISLERFYSSIKKREKEFNTYLMMGATLKEAITPYLREALKTAFAPTLSTMASIGLVSLPGMMTGQILGGSAPVVAIKYQIAIMISIFAAIVITAVVNIFFSLPIAFNSYHILEKKIFRDK